MSTDTNTPLVITLWETYGSNMEAVSAALAARTGLQVHAQAYSTEQLEQAQEEREKAGRFTQFLASFVPLTSAVGGDPTRTLAASEGSFRDLAEANTPVVVEQARQGGIIQGRNGQFLLNRRANAVHVKLDGPVAARIANAAKASGIDAGRAAKRQSLEDEFRADMSLKTYRFDPRDNDYYDVVINGATLTPEAAVDIIAATVKGKLGVTI